MTAAPDATETPRTDGPPAAAETPAKSPSDAPVDWRSFVTDPEAKTEAARTTDLNALFKRIRDMRGQLSKAVVPPGRDATPAQLADYRRKIGVPETADGYAVMLPPEVPDELRPTEENGGAARQAQFLDLFHRHNLTPEAVDDILGLYYAETTAQLQAQVAADAAFAEATEDALKADWQGEYAANRTYAARAGQEVFGPDFEAVRHLQDSAGRYVLDNPLMMRALARIGREMGEDRIGAVVAGGERESVQAQIDDLEARYNQARARGDDTQARALDGQLSDLYRTLHGGGAVSGSGGKGV